MVGPEHVSVPDEATEGAPDGSEVRVLVGSRHGGLAHFTFPAGETSRAVRHRTIDELWFVVTGTGRMWTSAGADEGFAVGPGTSVAIPAGTAFQVRVDAGDALRVVAASMPPWPGPGEAVVVDGPWPPTLGG